MKRLLPIAAIATTLAVTAMLPTAAFASKAQPNLGLGIRLADASVSQIKNPRAHVEIDDFMHPGTTEVRQVQVSDITPKPMPYVSVYAAPASIAGENFSIEGEGHTSDLTSWIKVTPSVLHLQPETSQLVTVTISVPKDATAGERYGAIVAQIGSTKQIPGQVTIDNRVGTRIYLDVGAGGEPASSFTVSTLTPVRLANGQPAVVAKVHNTGGRALDLDGVLNLINGPGGLRAGPFSVSQIPTLAIGASGIVSVTLNKQTPAGPWLARMKLSSGEITHTVQGRITFPLKAGTAGTPVKASPVPVLKNRHILLPIAGGLIGLLALALLLLFWKRRRKDDDDEDNDEAAPAAKQVASPASR